MCFVSDGNYHAFELANRLLGEPADDVAVYMYAFSWPGG